MTEAIDQRISNVFSMLFAVDESLPKAELNPETVPAWDSIGHMHLVQALEEEFAISFSDSQVVEMLNYPLVKMAVLESLESR